MLRGIFQSVAILFSTLTAVIIMHPGAVEWIVRVFLVTVTWETTRLFMLWKYGNKRAAIFKAERDTARAALAELQITTDHKVHVYRDAAVQKTVKGLVENANDTE